MNTRLFQKYQFDGVEGDSPSLIKGVIVCEKGEAKGHGFILGNKFLDQVVEIAKGKVFKVRMDHPEEGKGGKVLSIVGEISNFRRDGNKVRGDVKLFDVPAKKTIEVLARQASDLFGMSLDFIGRKGKEIAKGMTEMFCSEINAVDFVESPAAASSLLSTQVDSHSLDRTITIPEEMIEQLDLGENPDDPSIISAIGNAIVTSKEKLHMKTQKQKLDEKRAGGDHYPTVLKEHMEAMGSHLEALRSKLGESDEHKEHVDGMAAAYEAMSAALAEEPAPKKEEGDEEEKMSAKLQKTVKDTVAREITVLLAKAGVKPRASAPAGDETETIDPITGKPAKKTGAKLEKLSTEQEAEATALSIEEKDFPAHLEALNALSPEEMAIAKNLGIKPSVYLASLKKANVRLSAAK